MSQNVPINAIQVGDRVHWSSGTCGEDNFDQVVSLAPAGNHIVVIHGGVRQWINRLWIRSAVREDARQDKIGPVPDPLSIRLALVLGLLLAGGCTATVSRHFPSPRDERVSISRTSNEVAKVDKPVLVPLPPDPRPMLRLRLAAQKMDLHPPTNTAPQVTISWDSVPGPYRFELWSSIDLKKWQALTNTDYLTITLPAGDQYRFFKVFTQDTNSGLYSEPQ